MSDQPSGEKIFYREAPLPHGALHITMVTLRDKQWQQGLMQRNETNRKYLLRHGSQLVFCVAPSQQQLMIGCESELRHCIHFSQLTAGADFLGQTGVDVLLRLGEGHHYHLAALAWQLLQDLVTNPHTNMRKATLVCILPTRYVTCEVCYLRGMLPARYVTCEVCYLRGMLPARYSSP